MKTLVLSYTMPDGVTRSVSIQAASQEALEGLVGHGLDMLKLKLQDDGLLRMPCKPAFRL